MRRLPSVVVALTLSAACGGSPTAPTPGAVLAPAQTFEGVWNFKYRVEQCSGERHCFAVLNKTHDFSVRLVKSGLGYDGVVMLASSGNVDVKGTVGEDGALTLTGIYRPPQLVNSREAEVTRLRLSRQSDAVTGDFEYVTRGAWNSEFGPETRRGGPLVSAVKAADITPANSRELTGTWSGSIVTRDCTAIGHSGCTPLRPEELWSFELTITGTASPAGALLVRPTRMTLEASALGSAVVVQGVAEERNSAYTNVWTVRPSTLTRDEAGRLKGSLSMEWRRTYAATGDTVISDFRAIELLDVVLRPPS